MPTTLIGNGDAIAKRYLYGEILRGFLTCRTGLSRVSPCRASVENHDHRGVALSLSVGLPFLAKRFADFSKILPI
jgi:hypothetical protein